jgi:hypothetical protein
MACSGTALLLLFYFLLSFYYARGSKRWQRHYCWYLNTAANRLPWMSGEHSCSLLPCSGFMVRQYLNLQRKMLGQYFETHTHRLLPDPFYYTIYNHPTIRCFIIYTVEEASINNRNVGRHRWVQILYVLLSQATWQWRLQSWRWKQYISPKRLYPSVSPHDIGTHMTTMNIFYRRENLESQA